MLLQVQGKPLHLQIVVHQQICLVSEPHEPHIEMEVVCV
jgi:hypothetical protein